MQLGTSVNCVGKQVLLQAGQKDYMSVEQVAA